VSWGVREELEQHVITPVAKKIQKVSPINNMSLFGNTKIIIHKKIRRSGSADSGFFLC
jgi:hypothetical protein